MTIYNGMTEQEIQAIWNKADGSIRDWRDKCKKTGRKPNWKDLKCIATEMGSYGDYLLYVDTVDGKHYDDYFSIGD